jgi:preprotein translocase subunit SecA
VTAAGEDLRRSGTADLGERATELRRRLGAEGLVEDLVVRAFALVREAASRTLGMRPHDEQVVGGFVLLRGMLAEMETGEGKTLTATLPASVAALAGIPVHVVTSNDYLAARDAEIMGPVYRALGLTVASVTASVVDPRARRAAYACDVVYTTNKQVAFDYLRDSLVRGGVRGRLPLELERLRGGEARIDRLLLRGLCFAIVDEADSVLVDEARTPLILSRLAADTGEERVFRQALDLAARLERGRDFRVDDRGREVSLSETGRRFLETLCEELSGPWRGPRRREELVRTALVAVHLFARDRHYLVREGRVEIIDAHTGRTMPDRAFEHGLHQLIEAKEGCAVTGQRETLARISYQRFFRRYLRLAGMTGTAREVAGELRSVYGLEVVRIPTVRPVRRRRDPDETFATAPAKWRRVVDRVLEIHASGRPVLVGTCSVASSEHLSALLDAAKLPHNLLNARQDAEEAEVVARAGERGRITVATRMAGRGTDIRLGPGVAQLGGLFVLATERSEARRIDRQLRGRCGRQGDPGSCAAILSLEDELPALYWPAWLRGALAPLARNGRPLPGWLAKSLMYLPQIAVEARYRRMRRQLQQLDEELGTALAFAGTSE